MALQRLAAPRVTRTLAALAGASFAVRSLALPPPERVEFPSLDKDVTIQAVYFRPPGTPADKRVPLVVAAHGCGGMYSESPSRRYELSERSIAWTDMLLADGYAVLWPDSFTRAAAGRCAS
jgi:dipeptidyl aminopeptidase/acylaminoacyl peptidase